MYIISPWFFYIISIVDALKFTFILLLVCGAMLWTIYTCVYLACEDSSMFNPFTFLGKHKIFIILLFLLSICVPSSTTCYKMLITSQITTERVEDAKETITSVADYIIEATKEIEKAKNDD